MPRGEHDPCRRPNGDGATVADTTTELGCRRPLPRPPRVSCDPPGCGSRWWVAPPRLPALLSCRSSAEGGSLPCSRGRFSAVPSERLLISLLIWGLRNGRSPFSIALPHRVGNHGALMQVCKKARKDRFSSDRGCLKSSRALQLYSLFGFCALPVFLVFSVYSIFSVLLRSQWAQ